MPIKTMNFLRPILPGRGWALAAAFTVAMTFSSPAQAQLPGVLDFTACKSPTQPWVFLCTPVWNLPIMAPETGLLDLGRVDYYPESKVLEVSAIQFTTSFPGTNSFGNFEVKTSAVSAGHSKIRILVNSDGTLFGGAGNACDDGGVDDFCLTGEVTDPGTGAVYGPGVLLRGKIRHFKFAKQVMANGTYRLQDGTETGIEVPHDDFEFHIQLTGGDLFNGMAGGVLKPSSIWALFGSDNLAIEFFGWNPRPTDPYGPVPYTGDNPFAGRFTESFAFGYLGPTVIRSGLFCSSVIGDFVWQDLNRNGVQDAGEPALAGASVTLSGGDTAFPAVTTGGDGRYAFPGLCAGTYTIEASGPLYYAASPSGMGGTSADSDPSPATVVVNGDNGGNYIDFGFYFNPAVYNTYMTWGQGAWGAKPRGNNVATLLNDWFSVMYPTEDGVVIGLPDPKFSSTLTTTAAIQEFLPQGGKPAALTQNYVDPVGMLNWKHHNKAQHHRRITEFAGNVLALQLNVDFSAKGITRYGLGSLRLKSGPLASKTVNEVLVLANTALGGGSLPSGLTLTDLNTVIDLINDNFDRGGNKGYLIP